MKASNDQQILSAVKKQGLFIESVYSKRNALMAVILSSFILSLTFWSHQANAEADYERALKRAQYLLNQTIPTDEEFSFGASSRDSYRATIRAFIESDDFYYSVMRYHERLFGIGLPTNYLDELLRDDIDGKAKKFAKIECGKTDDRLRCYWASATEGSKVSSCPSSWEKAVSTFWYPGIVAWVCPSVLRACGSDLSRCFIQYQNKKEARNSELGTTEAFDSKFSVVKSLAKQPAGLATAVVIENYPYNKILEPGVTAVDGAVAHLYRQKHHFDLDKLKLPQAMLDIVDSIALTDTRFRLVNTGATYESGGIISTFGWLRRYEKNRTRANQLYERLLCRSFISELPKVFPQDPGNLREAPGCSGCHSTLDPLSDFFLNWGEGGELYKAGKTSVETTFGGQSGSSLSDLARIVGSDNAFATCTVENVWEWLMGRDFDSAEADVRLAFTNYFVQTNYSFKELVFALATHPAFIEGSRSDAQVSDPLSAPPLGEPPGNVELKPCDTQIDYGADLAQQVNDQCGVCHNSTSSSRQNLLTEAQLGVWAAQSVKMMSSGNMPPGQAGPPLIGAIFDLKESLRCWQEQK